MDTTIEKRELSGHHAPTAINERSTHVKKMRAEPIIRLLVEDNPKRLGSAAYRRFSFYEDGMTVEQYLDRGGIHADLKWDEEHRYIKLERFEYLRIAS